MARNDSAKKPKQHRNDSDPELLAHLGALGLPTVAEYVGWCAQHGFGRGIHKHWRLRLKERSYAHRAVCEARLSAKKQEQRTPGKIIERIFNGELREEDVTQPQFKAVCRACKAALGDSPRTQRAFRDLLEHVSECSDLLEGRPVIGQYGWQAGNTFVEGLLALARHPAQWVRPFGNWRPQTHNARRQFASLSRHLFAAWPVPAFMDAVWFLGSTSGAQCQQAWFIHLGNGQNIRTADLPLPYTKRMAHHFMQAPADLTVAAALRWGQICGLGGSERLARTAIGTRLGASFEHDEFWVTVLCFFIANPLLDLLHVGPIIDFIGHQRFAPQDGFVAPGIVERKGPAQPNFTMKGRTPESLLRQVESWHRTLAKTQQGKTEWTRSGIDGFELVEGSERGGNMKVWTIRELLSTKALCDEGRALRHCVATYAHSCARGASSIWTLEVESFEGRAKLLTIEVQNQGRLICQARGKCNALPAEKHRGILRRWAEKAGLSLARHV